MPFCLLSSVEAMKGKRTEDLQAQLGLAVQSGFGPGIRLSKRAGWCTGRDITVVV